MKLIYPQPIKERIAKVVSAWQYQDHLLVSSPNSKITAQRKAFNLLNPDTATADDVTAILGNLDWITPLTCDECGTESKVLVELGEEPDWDTATANICVNCLNAALKLINSTSGESGESIS